MKIIQLLPILFFVILSCTVSSSEDRINSSYSHFQNTKKLTFINTEGMTVMDRFVDHSHFERTEIDVASFGYYLRNLPLKKQGSKVNYFNGVEKSTSSVYIAVVDKEIGNKDLHQCADAVMRLRADYLFDNKRFNDIHFNFTNGFRVDYSEWMKGKRISVKGNNVKWIQKKTPSNTYQDYWSYLEQIFMYAGTLSLDNELVSVKIHDMQIGDVFIKGGSPGHAIIVVDMLENTINKNKKFLLAQSFMPAQEIQILRNPAKENDPWYELNSLTKLISPEWQFSVDQLKRFDN